MTKIAEKVTHTPLPWSTGGISTQGNRAPYTGIWGPTPEGMQSGTWIAKEVPLPDADLIVNAVNCHADLLDALKRVLTGFEENAFQRNTDGDGDSGWAIKFMPHLMALADAARAIAKAEGKR